MWHTASCNGQPHGVAPANTPVLIIKRHSMVFASVCSYGHFFEKSGLLNQSPMNQKTHGQ